MKPRAGWLAAVGWAVPGALFAATLSWPQFDFDARKSGVSQQETAIHAGNVATLHPVAGYPVTLSGLLGTTTAIVADGAPAFLAGVQTAAGTRDLLFLTTKDGRLLAIDAATGSLLWSRQPASGPRYTTSSPAIDPSQLYVYSYGLDGKAHKYQVGDGTEVTTGGWPEIATIKPDVEKGSSALSIVTAQSGSTYLIVANGGYPGDAGNYQGHVTVVDLATGGQRVFNADCSDQAVHFAETPLTPSTPFCSAVQSAIWARPGVVYDAELDRLFMATGNGVFDANLVPPGHEWGDSVLALHPDGTGSGGGLPVDSYTPTEFQALQNLDADLGSTAPAILPSPNGSNHPYLGVQSGKDAKIRLLNLQDLSGAGGPAHLGGELQILDVPQGGEVLTQPAVWRNPADGKIWLFLANGAGLAGLQLTIDVGGNPSLASQWTSATGGTSPIVVNGILYYSSLAGLRALDPTTGSQLWASAAPIGLHWESPIVVGGRLYATDDSGHLLAWEPDPEPLSFFTVPPCRLIDTRNAIGTYGGPALQGGTRRNFPVGGQCGVPPGARAIAVNVTVIGPASAGVLTVGPTGVTLQTSTVNFGAGQTRANNAVTGLSGNPLGSLTVAATLTGAANLAVDVVGYFQ